MINDRYSKIGSKNSNMLENAWQHITCDFDVSQVLWNIPSQVYSIATCGWAYRSRMCSCPHFGHFAAIKFKECKADSKTIQQFNSMQISCVFLYEISQKGLGNFWNFRGFPAVFPSLIFSHSKLGIPFTLGQISIRHLQTAPQLVL